MGSILANNFTYSRWLTKKPHIYGDFNIVQNSIHKLCSILELVRMHFALSLSKGEEFPPPAWPKPLRRGEGPRKIRKAAPARRSPCLAGRQVGAGGEPHRCLPRTNPKQEFGIEKA